MLMLSKKSIKAFTFGSKFISVISSSSITSSSSLSFRLRPKGYENALPMILWSVTKGRKCGTEQNPTFTVAPFSFL